MKRENVLITGANGFLARAVLRQLYNDCDWQLFALVRSASFTSSNFHSVYNSVDKLVSEIDKIDIVLHLAACIPSPISADRPELMETNVDLVGKLIHAFPEARHVLASSVSVYGTPVSLPLNIKSSYNQPTAYGLSKIAAEDLVRETPNHAIIRFSSLIGVGMKAGSFIPSIVSAAQSGKIYLRGLGERKQNYVDIDDAALMCIRSSLNEKSFTALGIGEKSYSNNEVAEILSDLTGASVVYEGTDESPSYVYEFSDAVDIGQRQIDLKASLEKMVRQL